MILDLAGKWNMRVDYQSVTAEKAQQILRMDRKKTEHIEIKQVGDRGKTKIWLSEEGFLEQELPGDVTEGLMRAGILREPLEGTHSEECQWVEKVAFWLIRDVTVTKEMLQEDEIRLFLELVDYHADVLINGIPCGEHANVYRPLEADIKEALHEGMNEIALRLTGGSEEQHPSERMSWFCAMDYCDNDERFYLRKPQYTYGWDWCPKIPTCGIGGRMEIRTFCGAVMKRHRVDTLELLPDGSARAELFFAIDKTRPEQAEEAALQWELTDPDGKTVCREKKELYLAGGRNFCRFPLQIPAAQLWWPNGCGEQKLYRLHAELSCAGKVDVLEDELVGIRTISIRQDKLDEDSRRFDVLVNGQKVFCRGGNWVPADSLYLRIPREKYQRLIREAAECNFNMLRVWGGGVYEPDIFYEECTKKGILVFQDFMYCCAYYPDSDAFLHEAAEEAVYQTRRLAKYPCMAIWSGGNEIHESITDWFGRRPPKLWGKRIFHELLPEILAANAPTAFYMPSSPYFGAPTDRTMRGEYPEISADPETGKYANSALCGDTHAWNFLRRDEKNRFRYNYEPEAFDRFPARFSSEFGIHGCLMESSMRRALGLAEGEPFSMEAPAWKHHGEQPWKRGYILSMIENHARSAEGLTPEEYLFYGGLMQGYVYQDMAEAVRLRPYGSGMLIWMFDDCWPETGWTVVDYYLTRKLAFYPLKRAFAPHKLIIREKPDGTVAVKVMNEGEEDQRLELEVGTIACQAAGEKGCYGENREEPDASTQETKPGMSALIRPVIQCLKRHSSWECVLPEKELKSESPADTPADAFDKTAFANFAPARDKNDPEDCLWYVRCLNHPEYEPAVSLRSVFRNHCFPEAKIEVRSEPLLPEPETEQGFSDCSIKCERTVDAQLPHSERTADAQQTNGCRTAAAFGKTALADFASARYKDEKQTGLLLTLRSNTFVPSVVLRCLDDRTHLSDNCFFLLPGIAKQVRVYGTEELPEVTAVKFEPRTR